jgi:hypothetical protein
MNEIKHIDDQIVDQTVEEAVAAACEVLDGLFPGHDAGGITSNFQGLLKSNILEMLQGRAPRRASTVLPKLVLTDDDFGPDLILGTMVLPIRIGHVSWGMVDGRLKRIGVEILGLEDASGQFASLTRIGDCFTSRTAAAKALRKWLSDEGCTREQFEEMNLLIAPVEFLDGDGLKVKDWYMADVVEPMTASLPRPWERSKA